MYHFMKMIHILRGKHFKYLNLKMFFFSFKWTSIFTKHIFLSGAKAEFVFYSF